MMGLFGGRGTRRAGPTLDGLITFFGSHQALRAESVLKKAGVEVRLVPGPREISPNCGVALRFPLEREAEVLAFLAAGKAQYEALHDYPESPDTKGGPR